ncbi:phospholipase A2 group XV-like isoform X2 [Panonychus citri]|nr:phospholipase A2 group XV-like isoform X2 [Panonychus citri]
MITEQSTNYLHNQSKGGKSILFPIILVPGVGGSQIEAKLDKKDVVHHFCDSHTDYYFTLWISLSEALPYAIDCFTDNMRLVYDNVTRLTSNSPGVETRIPGFGETQTIEYLDPNQIPLTGYFNIMVDYLINLGYERGRNIRGAPYDFRKSPRELTDYLDKLKLLIEETSESNYGSPCILICHSMGCPLMLYFLLGQSAEWKSIYIRNLITLASPWGGAVKAMKAFATGENLGVLLVPNLSVRRDERTFPSMAFLLPSQDFWPTTETIIKVGSANYSTANYEQFFENISYPVGYQMWLDVNNILSNLPAPNVPVSCIYGVGTQTMEYLEYDPPEKFPNHRPNIIHGDGDGTVNLRSLEGCLRWTDQQTQSVDYLNVTGADHLSILADPNVLNYIKKIATAQN